MFLVCIYIYTHIFTCTHVKHPCTHIFAGLVLFPFSLAPTLSLSLCLGVFVNTHSHKCTPIFICTIKHIQPTNQPTYQSGSQIQREEMKRKIKISHVQRQ